MELLYRLIIRTAHLFFRIQGVDIRVTGTEHIPERGGAIYTVNHTGYLDAVYAGIPATDRGRFPRYLAKQELFANRFAGAALRHLKQIPVDRTAGADAYAAAVRALRDGELLAVYPEATISRSFETKAFKTGAARMALEAGVPVIPVTVWGAQRVWTKGRERNLWRPKVPIYIRVEPPVEPRGSVSDLTAQLRRTMQGSLERLHDVHRAEHGPYPEGAYWVPRRFGGGAPTLEEADVLDDREAEERMRKRAEGQG